MTNLLERIKDFTKENEEILSVESIPLSELSEVELEELSEDELEQSEYAILVTSNSESYDLEGLLYELDILFISNGDKKSKTFTYKFLEFYEDYQPFNQEVSFKAFQKFCRLNKEILDEIYFPLGMFEDLKEQEIIPYNYELYATTKNPEDVWEINHYILYDKDTPIYSKSVNDIFSNKKKSIENWAKELFLKIEENEKP